MNISSLLDIWLACSLINLVLCTISLVNQNRILHKWNWLISGLSVYVLSHNLYYSLLVSSLCIIANQSSNYWLPNRWGAYSQALYTSLGMTHAAFITKIIHATFLSPSKNALVFSIFSVISLLGLLIVDLLSTYEVLDGLSVDQKSLPPAFTTSSEKYPKVSIHIPIYREPVPIVQKTLLSISKLEYPDFEVVVVYNNTKDEQLWHPIRSTTIRITPQRQLEMPTHGAR